MINILEIIGVAENGGAEKATRLQTKVFSRKGYNVFFIHPEGPYSDEFKTLEASGVKITVYNLKQKNVLKTMLFLRQFIKKHKISVIHSHKYWADFISVAARAGLRNIRQFCSIHDIYHELSFPGILVKPRVKILSSIALKNCDKVFAISDEVNRKIRKYYNINEKKVVTTLNGIDFNELETDELKIQEIRKKYNIKEENTVLLCAGALIERKGQKYLIEAMRKFIDNENIICFLIGYDDGAKRDYLKIIDKLGLENRVILPGYCKNAPDWISIADIYIHPAINDTLPRALLEAMYMKKPCITSDISTLKAVVTHMDNGIIVKNRSSKEIADAISLLIKDRELSSRIAENGHNFVKNNCSIERMVSKMDNEIRKLVPNR